MTLASRRLIRKRPFIVVSLGWRASGDRQRSGGRNEQKSGNERARESGGGVADRQSRVHFQIPFCLSRGPTTGPVPDIMQGACQLENIEFFQWHLSLDCKNYWRNLPPVGKNRRRRRWNCPPILSGIGHALQM